MNEDRRQHLAMVKRLGQARYFQHAHRQRLLNAGLDEGQARRFMAVERWIRHWSAAGRLTAAPWDAKLDHILYAPLSAEDREFALFTVEELLRREMEDFAESRMKEWSAAWIETERDRLNRRKNQRAGFAAASDNRQTATTEFWGPWRTRWIELQDQGLGRDTARTAVDSEMEAAGVKRSRSSLKRHLR